MDKLKEEVQEIIDNHAQGYDDGAEGFISDLSQGGCQSGLVGELVYYSDTLPFYEKHREAIGELLQEKMEEVGFYDPSTILREWDKSDPLVLETQNKNLLAWFAFEETAYAIARDNYIYV